MPSAKKGIKAPNWRDFFPSILRFTSLKFLLHQVTFKPISLLLSHIMMEAMLARTIHDINKQTRIAILISEQYARPILPIIHYGYVLKNGGAVLEGTSQELMENPDVKSTYFGL